MRMHHFLLKFINLQTVSITFNLVYMMDKKIYIKFQPILTIIF